MNENEWYAQPENGQWAVRQRSDECMRIGSDGSFSIGIKSYWFKTQEWAELCAMRLDALDWAVRGKTMLIANGGIFKFDMSNAATYSFQFNSNPNKTVLLLSRDGEIVKFDLPFFVWGWLRNTPLVRGLKRFWYGERGHE